ncbi:ferritin-1, chloroplastic isoform X3 [Cicer arietinum]|uniref:ferritin-1, chloroplastic isoform X3 n=1 Tax=Cicer arietinum TaxID=3827 RepID=UPI00064126FC
MALFSSSKVSSFSGFSLSPISGNNLKKPTLSFCSCLRVNEKWGSRKLSVCAATTVPLTGVIFEPFEEVKKDNLAVPIVPQVSLARHHFSDECESVINEQINVEYNISYVYHSMFAYFDRDNVALKGLAKFFKESSKEEREHAEKLMKYQVADRNNDREMTHFIESEFLSEQVEAIKKIAEYVSQLRRVGKCHGVWHFDQRLLHEEHAA